MKRFHIHVGARNIEQSVQFYSTLFGQKPTKLKKDYAKWMLEDPRLNFAISTRSNTEGVDHVGVQVEDDRALLEITSRLKNADIGILEEGKTTCCYAESNKAWVKDPSGLAWEVYQNIADVEVYSEGPEPKEKEDSCCIPGASDKTSCC